MKIPALYSILFALTVVYPCAAQVYYPFSERTENDILAYCYNCPEDSVTWQINDETDYFHSSLNVYGRAPAKEFTVNVRVLLRNGSVIFDKRYEVNEKTEYAGYTVEYVHDFFKIDAPVTMSSENPDRIHVELSWEGGKRSNEIKCRYHKVYGNITDFYGNPFKGFISFRPDAFGFPTGVWSDDNGFYEITLPARTYNSVYVDDESYGIKTLEAWGWHIILDEDQRLDFSIGNGEVYNLNVWPNNGGFGTYFISFRPMALPELIGMKESEIEIEGTPFKVSDIAPNITKDDLSITVNGIRAEIVSVQKYYETGIDAAMPAYLVQVRKRGLPRVGKLSFMVSYSVKSPEQGSNIEFNSMGYFQFYPNFKSNSKYY